MIRSNKGSRITQLVSITVLAVFILFTPFNPEANHVYADGDWKSWKQYEGDWALKVYVDGGKYKFGTKVSEGERKSGYGTVGEWGCYLVSMSIQIARSGAKTDFTPWDFIEHMNKGKYMTNGSDGLKNDIVKDEHGVETFTDNKFRVADDNFVQDVAGKSKDDIIKVVKSALDDGYYPIIKLVPKGGGTHFVAVDSVTDSEIKMFDPGSKSSDFFKQYGESAAQEVRVFESDVKVQDATGAAQTGDEEKKEEEDTKENVNLKVYSWDEGAIPGMPKPRAWEETPTPVTSYYDLEQEQRESIEKWKAEVEQSKQVGWVTTMRVGTMILGIASIIFSLVYLVAFMFDRVTITEWRAVEWITRDRLSVSGTGESTFFKGTSYPKLINVRDLIVIESLLIGFSMLILSGGIFTVVGWIIALFKMIQDIVF